MLKLSSIQDKRDKKYKIILNIIITM